MSNLPATNPKLVQTFLEKYSPPERKAEVMKLAYIILDVENVHKFFWLPSKGPNVGNLSNLGLNVADCFLLGTVFEELDENQKRVKVKKAPKVALLPSWKYWIHWVQLYLELDTDSLQVSPSTVRASMAIKLGLKLNWAKYLTKRLHDTVVAILKDPSGQLVGGQYLMHLIREQLRPFQVNRVKMIKTEEAPARIEVEAHIITFDPKAEMKCTLQDLSRWMNQPSEVELLASNL